MDIPTVQITIDHMRHEIIKAFSAYTKDLQNRVAEVVKDVVDKFNFKAEVNKLAEVILREQIKKVLQSAWIHLEWDTEIKKALAEALVRGLSNLEVSS